MPESIADHQLDLERLLADAAIVPPSELPLYEEILSWLSEKLKPAGLSLPLCKRLAVVVAGLVASRKATIGELTTAIESLAISEAKPESIARRLQRSLRDARLDPGLLPSIFRPILPELLRSSLAAHTANRSLPSHHHRRFVALSLIFDESSQQEHVHLALVGIPIGRVVLPLAVRTWPQNAPLAEGEYWMQVTGLFQEVQASLPAELRAHVLLVADRLSGVPRMLDLLSTLDWHWLLRAQGQVRVRLPDGTIRSLRTLVPRPGSQWTSDPTGELDLEADDLPDTSVFKAVGWRPSRVVAVWAEGQAEPWLLLTSLAGTLARVAEYASRWSIERLFLAWKSHGWEIEQSGVHDPVRLGRLLTCLALATLWRIAFALPRAFEHLADLASRSERAPRQLPLPGFGAIPRPWVAKFSLLSWGAKVAQACCLQTRTPALCWQPPFVAWQGYDWAEICRIAHLSALRQFSASP